MMEDSTSESRFSCSPIEGVTGSGGKLEKEELHFTLLIFFGVFFAGLISGFYFGPLYMLDNMVWEE